MKKFKAFREAKKWLRKNYIVFLGEKDGDLYIPIPGDIVKAFGIRVYDIAIFEIENKKKIIVRFVKKNLYSFVEKVGGLKNETRRSIKQIKKRKKQAS